MGNNQSNNQYTIKMELQARFPFSAFYLALSESSQSL